MELQTDQEPSPVSTDAVENLMDILDDTPLLPGEKPEDYQAIYSAIMREVRPSTALEYILVRELVACVYDERRYRRLRETYIHAKIVPILEEKLQKAISFDAEADAEAKALDMYSHNYPGYLARNWVAGFSDIRRITERILDAGGLSYDDVLASVIASHMHVIQGYEALIDHAIKGRNRVIAELERRKDRKQALIEKMSAIAGEVGE